VVFRQQAASFVDDDAVVVVDVVVVVANSVISKLDTHSGLRFFIFNFRSNIVSTITNFPPYV
jgi:hypothetical protein